MKAKEYAVKFIEDTSTENLKSIMVYFLHEVATIAKARDGKSDAAFTSILEEQNRKWKAFCRIVNKELQDDILLESGFEMTVKEQVPDSYILWKGYST